MDEQPGNAPRRRYRWPWIVLTAFILWVLLAIGWMSIAVHHVEQQRDFSAPPGGGAH